MGFPRLLALLTAAAFLAGMAACGDDDAASTTTEPPPTTAVVETTEPSRTTAVVETTEPTPATEPEANVRPRSDTLDLGLVGCDRFGFFARVNPEAAVSYVPDGHELWLVEDDALFALHVMSCDDLVTDGASHGPGHFGTVWIRIIGPEEAVTLPPDSDLVAQPTDSFHAPLFQTDNESFHAATNSFGIPMTLAELMTSDPPIEGAQTGEVIDLDYSPPISYRWTVDNVNWMDASPVGLHNLFGLDDQGAPLTYYGEFAHEPGWSGNVGTVELEPGSAFEDLLGTSATGPVNGDPVTIDMTVFRVEGSE